jgi:hypothetical protein
LTISSSDRFAPKARLKAASGVATLDCPVLTMARGGKYLLLSPDYEGTPPAGFFTLRSRTYGVFVFWRGFFKDPKQLEEPVRVMEQTRIYPLGKEASAKPMQFPNASVVPANMLYPTDGSAFDVLARFIEHEYVDPADMEMRGMLATLGIEKGKPFNPDQHLRGLLDQGARTAFRIGHIDGYERFALYYKDRQWRNVFPENATFTAPTFNYTDLPGVFHDCLFNEPGDGGQHGQRGRKISNDLR